METESETGKSMQETQHNTAEEARQKRYIYMTQTPIPRLIRDLSIPTIISMLVSGLYNMADTFFVGKLSTQATAAVGIVFFHHGDHSGGWIFLWTWFGQLYVEKAGCRRYKGSF